MVLPITTDSHFGEYIQWADDVADHRRIIGFYNWQRAWREQQVPESRIEGTYEEEHWTVVPMMEAILADAHFEDLAVNVLNEGVIDNLPNELVVEVPAVVDGRGVHGVKVGALPKGIVGLLSAQLSIQDLTVEAVLKRQRDVALQALLVDPTINRVRPAEQLVETMLDLQKEYLGYLK